MSHSSNAALNHSEPVAAEPAGAASSQVTLDRDASDQLVRDHMMLVHTIAMRMKLSLGRTLDMDELVAYGSRGLVEAARRFDPTRGVVFATFAFHRIRGAIVDGVRSSGWYTRAQCAEYRSQQVGGAELPANDNGQPADTEAQLAALAAGSTSRASIYITSYDAAHATAEDGLDADPECPAAQHERDPHAVLEQKQLGERVRAVVHALPFKERQLIELYYFSDLTLEQAGAKMGLSKSWSSRVHDRALRLLKDALRKDPELPENEI